MKIEAIIYSKPNCMKCKMTKSLLKVFISSQSCDIIMIEIENQDFSYKNILNIGLEQALVK